MKKDTEKKDKCACKGGDTACKGCKKGKKKLKKRKEADE